MALFGFSTEEVRAAIKPGRIACSERMASSSPTASSWANARAWSLAAHASNRAAVLPGGGAVLMAGPFLGQCDEAVAQGDASPVRPTRRLCETPPHGSGTGRS